MKRAFKFFLVFIAAALLVLWMVVGLNYSAFKSLFANSEGMAEGSEYVSNTFSLKGLTTFIGEHPEYVSIVSFNVSDPDSGIFYGADIPRTMGTLGNLFLLVEYERQVATGTLNPDETIDLTELNNYALPEINQNDHEGTMEFLAGYEGPITLNHAMNALLEYRSLALADYFWFKLGEDNLRALITALELPDTEMPIPFSGMYSVLHPDMATHPVEAHEHFSNLAQVERAELHQRMIDAARFYADDTEAQKLRSETFEKDRLAMTFMEERDALEFFPHSTAADLTSLLYNIWHETLITPEVSRAIKEKLRWSMDSEPIQRSFTDYGALYDNRMGMLSGLDFGTSIYDGHSSVQVVFFDKLPVAFWLHMSSNHMQEDYQQRVIWDPALYETTNTEISVNQ